MCGRSGFLGVVGGLVLAWQGLGRLVGELMFNHRVRSTRRNRRRSRVRVVLNLGVLFRVLPIDGGPEVTESAPELTSHLGQLLRSEDQQRDREYEQEMGWLEDVADHRLKSVLPLASPGRTFGR